MQFDAHALSDIGRRRAQNQDAWLIDSDLHLYIVCDGMGGHAAGDIASKNAARMTARYIREHRQKIEQALATPGGHFKVVQTVTDCVRATCQKVHDMARQSPGCAGMGTTLTMLLMLGDKAILAHVGDSRLYLLRGSNLHQMTNDHTLANELIQTGRVAAGSPEAARYNHVLTRAIGQQQYVDVDTLLFDLIPDDRFLLCSDGLSNYLTSDDEVVRLLQQGDLNSAAEKFVTLANSRGGQDNITCLLVRTMHADTEQFRQSQVLLNALEATFLSRGLSLNRRIQLANIGELRCFEPNQPIIEKGDKRRGMYVVLSGHCRQINPNGNTVDLTEADTFGETALARAERFHIQVRAITQAQTLFIGRKEFRALSRRLPKLGRRLLNNLLDHISQKYDELLEGDEVLEGDEQRTT